MYKQRYFSTARILLRIDCETISRPSQQEGFSGKAITSLEHEEEVHKTKPPPTASHTRRTEETEVSGCLTVGNNGICSPQEVLSCIALKTFQPVDPSKTEELNGFLKYMEQVRKVLMVGAKQGSLLITVECKSLEILDRLWEDYCEGYMNEMAQKYLVTEDILKDLGLTDVTLATTILEEEYRACRKHLLHFSGEFRG